MVWFTEADLENFAGGRSFRRGLRYVDAVTNVRDLPDGVVATVHSRKRNFMATLRQRGL